MRRGTLTTIQASHRRLALVNDYNNTNFLIHLQWKCVFWFWNFEDVNGPYGKILCMYNMCWASSFTIYFIIWIWHRINAPNEWGNQKIKRNVNSLNCVLKLLMKTISKWKYINQISKLWYGRMEYWTPNNEYDVKCVDMELEKPTDFKPISL